MKQSWLSGKYSLFFYTLRNQGIAKTSRLFLEFFNSITEPTYVRIKPAVLHIEPTIRCNLACTFCDHAIWDRKCKDMTLKQFKYIINQFPYAREINLQGLGEPLLNKEFFDMVKYAKSRKIKVRITTNGTLLDENRCQMILESGLDQISISLDTSNPKTYESIRKGAKFNEVIKKIKLLVSKNIPSVIITTVLVKENIDDILSLIGLVSEMGIFKMNIQFTQTFGKEVWKNKFNYDLNEKFIKLRPLWEKKAKRLNIDLKFSLTKTEKRRCKWPWMSCYITVDGFVTPCCMHGSDPRNLNFGNIFKESFDKIWNNNQYKRFRENLKSGKIPGFCKGCSEVGQCSSYIKPEV